MDNWTLTYIEGRAWKAQVRKPDGSGWTSKWIPTHFTKNQPLEAERWLISWYEIWQKSLGRARVVNRLVELKDLTLSYMAPKWLELRFQHRGTALNTYQGFQNSLKNWILDNPKRGKTGELLFPHTSIENLNLETDFTIPVLREWIYSLQGEEKSKIQHIRTLKVFFNDCIKQEWVDSEMLNPFDKPAIKEILVEMAKSSREEHITTHLTVEQAQTLLTGFHARLTDYRRMRYLVALTTGLRDHEIQGLIWADIDATHHTLSCTRQLVHGGPKPFQQYEKLPNKEAIKTCSNALTKNPKKNSKREFPLHPLLKAALPVWKKAWKAYAGRSPMADDPIFPRENRSLNNGAVAGDFCVSDSPELLRLDLERLDLPTTFKGIDLVFHSLRHTFSTILEATGLDDAKIGVLLGHGSRSTARSNYIGQNLELYRGLIAGLPFDSILLDSGMVSIASETEQAPKLRLVKSL